MKHQIFTFSAISHDSRYLQSHTIWQNMGKNLTNLIYFMIYVDKNTEKGVKMVIYDGEICLTTLYYICSLSWRAVAEKNPLTVNLSYQQTLILSDWSAPMYL